MEGQVWRPSRIREPIRHCSVGSQQRVLIPGYPEFSKMQQAIHSHAAAESASIVDVQRLSLNDR